MFRFLPFVLAFGLASVSFAEDLPIFEAHVHYSHDAVKRIPPAEVVSILREAGVKKALVSSSDDNGTQLLYEAAPDLIVPALRPYRRRGETGTWMNDPSVIDYLEKNLAQNTYFAIGEYHAFGDDARTDVFQAMVQMAKERNLILHHHGDAEAIEIVFETWPEARVIWAHSGFDRPDEVGDLLRKHDQLWADLAYRSDMKRAGTVDPQWRAVFEEFPDRFMVGTDTFAPERWYYVGSHAVFTRGWLEDLDDDLAYNIAYGNAAAMLGIE